MRGLPALALGAALAAALPPAARAHDGAGHKPEATPHDAEPAAAAAFPVEIRPRFSLVDTAGQPVTEADFAGRPMAVFFGYASCESICPVALAQMGAALDLLGPAADGIAAVMISVDPARDTPAALAAALAAHHPRLIGLTGSETALTAARAAFQVEVKPVIETPEGEPVYAHGSFIYLVGRDGLVKSVLPPVLRPERLAALMRKHF